MNNSPISRTTLIILAGTALVIAGLILAQIAYGQETPACDPSHKEWICHVPPGDPANVHSICIDQSAWVDPHEKHGDTKGVCPNPTITCGDPVKIGDGVGEMTVTATGWQMTGPFEVFTIGPVEIVPFTCAPPEETKWACTWQGRGDTKYEGIQKIVVRFDQKYGDSVECEMDQEAGGLPVELQEFRID